MVEIGAIGASFKFNEPERRKDGPPDVVAYEDVPSFIRRWGRYPRYVYGAPIGRWVTNPRTKETQLYETMGEEDRAAYDLKARSPDGQKTGIMRDSDPFISPIDRSYISGRAARREHINRYDVIEAGDVDWDETPCNGYVEPTDREEMEMLKEVSDKLEQGYYDLDPDRDDRRHDNELYWNGVDNRLRKGGL